jgi:hypothetical protein
MFSSSFFFHFVLMQSEIIIGFNFHALHARISSLLEAVNFNYATDDLEKLQFYSRVEKSFYLTALRFKKTDIFTVNTIN